jgi:hypothetical protein
VKPEETAFATQRLSKHIPAATNTRNNRKTVGRGVFYTVRVVIFFCLSRDRSIASSKLRSPKSAILSLSPDEESRIFFGERLSRKRCNVVVFPFAVHIAVQQPLKPLWSRLLLCDHEPSQPSTVLCFMSLLMSLLPTSGEFVSEFPSPRAILSFFPPP